MRLAAMACLFAVPAAVLADDFSARLHAADFSARLHADDVAARLKAHVEYLASDDLAGRDVGSEGIRKAEEHVASAFGALGLHPLPGHDSLFLAFDLHREGFDPDCTWARLETSRTSVALIPGADFRPFDFSGEGLVSADVVFAGYGITSPDPPWDDYDGLDVRGRIVLVLRHVPREDDSKAPFAGVASTEHATFTAKAENARAHGATAILVVTDPLHHPEAEDLRWGGGLRLPPIPPADTPQVQVVAVRPAKAPTQPIRRFSRCRSRARWPSGSCARRGGTSRPCSSRSIPAIRPRPSVSRSDPWICPWGVASAPR